MYIYIYIHICIYTRRVVCCIDLPLTGEITHKIFEFPDLTVSP